MKITNKKHPRIDDSIILGFNKPQLRGKIVTDGKTKYRIGSRIQKREKGQKVKRFTNSFRKSLFGKEYFLESRFSYNAEYHKIK